MKAPKPEELEHICAYCEYATLLSGADVCVCKKKGAVRANGTCRRFRPDLLKLQPHLPLLPEESDDEAFDVLIDP